MLSGGIWEQRTGNLSREHHEIWLKEQNRLSKPEIWAAMVQTKQSKEMKAEAKLVKELFPGATEMKETLDLNLTILKGQPTGGGTCQTISCV